MIYNKITKEQFNKLNQLDRIELRQKIQWLENKKPNGWTLGFIIPFVNMTLYVILLGVCVGNISLNAMVSIFSSLPAIVKMGLIGSLIIFGVEVIVYLRYKKVKEEIYSDYFDFKFEVKKKR